jgi:dephospho-CoA kinase
MPGDEKRALADEVIDCSGTIQETEREVDMVFAKLQKAAAAARNKS